MQKIDEKKRGYRADTPEQLRKPSRLQIPLKGQDAQKARVADAHKRTQDAHKRRNKGAGLDQDDQDSPLLQIKREIAANRKTCWGSVCQKINTTVEPEGDSEGKQSVALRQMCDTVSAAHRTRMLANMLQEWAKAAIEDGFPVCSVESSVGNLRGIKSPQEVDTRGAHRSVSVASKSPPVGEAELEAELRDFLGSRTPSPELSTSPILAHVQSDGVRDSKSKLHDNQLRKQKSK